MPSWIHTHLNKWENLCLIHITLHHSFFSKKQFLFRISCVLLDMQLSLDNLSRNKLSSEACVAKNVFCRQMHIWDSCGQHSFCQQSSALLFYYSFLPGLEHAWPAILQFMRFCQKSAGWAGDLSYLHCSEGGFGWSAWPCHPRTVET